MIFMLKVFAITGATVIFAAAYLFCLKLADLAWKVISRVGLGLLFLFLLYLVVCAICLM